MQTMEAIRNASSVPPNTRNPIAALAGQCQNAFHEASNRLNINHRADKLEFIESFDNGLPRTIQDLCRECYDDFGTWCYSFEVYEGELDARLFGCFPDVLNTILLLLMQMEQSLLRAPKARVFTLTGQLIPSSMWLEKVAHTNAKLFELSFAIENSHSFHGDSPTASSGQRGQELQSQRPDSLQELFDYKLCFVIHIPIGSSWWQYKMASEVLLQISNRASQYEAHQPGVLFTRRHVSRPDHKALDLKTARDALLVSPEANFQGPCLDSLKWMPEISNISGKFRIIFLTTIGFDGVPNFERYFLEQGKRLRINGASADQGTVTCVQLETNPVIDGALKELQDRIQVDQALQGTIRVAVAPFDLLSVTEQTYENILEQASNPSSTLVDELPDEQYAEYKAISHDVQLRGLSSWTKSDILLSCFGKYGSIRTVEMKQGEARIVYFRMGDAWRACRGMDGTRFDGNIIRVFQEETRQPVVNTEGSMPSFAISTESHTR